MQSLKLYYSDSLLSTYLNDSKDTLSKEPSSDVPGIPEISVVAADKQRLDGPEDSRHDAPSPSLTLDLTMNLTMSLIMNLTIVAPSTNGKNPRASLVSMTPTLNSMYSSVSENSADLDLQSVKLELDSIEQPKPHRFRRLLRSKEKPEPELNDDDKFVRYVCDKLTATCYHYEKTSTLNVPWRDAVEVFFFGDTLDGLFLSKLHILSYVMQSSIELGEPRFSNLLRYHEDCKVTFADILRQLEPVLEQFNSVLDLYAESETNFQRPELFELFSGFANHAEGMCLPLAISMFGRWLLAYNRDSAVESNFENALILNFFRKGVRLALAIDKIADLFNEDLKQYDGATLLTLQRFFNKDNKNALLVGLHGLGEAYQYNHDHDVSVSLWEINCHLTGDTESGNLAILGLTDGYGFGNRIRERNKLGKRSKTNKFNTKRRVAHLYRILMKQPGFDEYGVSWAEKEKYD